MLILKIIAGVVFLFAVGCAYSYIEETILTKSMPKKEIFISAFKNVFEDNFILRYICWGICIVSVFVVPVNYYYDYVTYIPDGTYCYYALVKHEDKTYTLPAEVVLYSHDEHFSSAGLYDNTPYKNIGNRRAFHIDRFYWPNGGYCFFGEDCDESNIVTFSEYNDMYDYHDAEYSIKLLDERANHPEIFEYTKEKPFPKDAVFCSIGLICTIFNLIIFTILRKR
ncbi:MAG: hypothetical protein IJN27_01880 [Oscillospiraceae bacterium]|nr:hypothetical protein [Oscillospiraceae bacterium]